MGREGKGRDGTFIRAEQSQQRHKAQSIIVEASLSRHLEFEQNGFVRHLWESRVAAFPPRPVPSIPGYAKPRRDEWFLSEIFTT